MTARRAAVLLLFLAARSPALADDNVLSTREKQDGWILLFDGRTTDGWITKNGKPVEPLHVQNGALNPHPCDYMLVYEKPVEDFTLSLDFRITPGCNSGVFVRTWPLTPRPGKDIGFNGIEIAIDDTTAAGYHDTGALYDLVAPEANAMKPAGEWNRLLVTCDKSRIDVELNGRVVTHADLDEFTEPYKRPNGTVHKFDVAYKNHPRKGYVGLQDHGSDIWFRNIKLRELRMSDPQKSEAPSP